MLGIFESIFGSYPFIFCTNLLSCSFKAYLLYNLVINFFKNKKISIASIYLIVVLLCSVIIDSAWVLMIMQSFLFPQKFIFFTHSWVHISWSFSAIHYQVLALSLEALVNKRIYPTYHQMFFSIISSLFFIFFISAATFEPTSATFKLVAIGYNIIKIYILYLLFILMSTTIAYVTWYMRTKHLPFLLKKQLQIIIQTLIIPYLVCIFFQAYPFHFYSDRVTNNFTLIGVSTLIFTYALYSCMRRIIGLRFLNLNSHVQKTISLDFIDQFKDVLERLSFATNEKELSHITQIFFKDAFNIPINRTQLYLRSLKVNAQESEDINRTEELVETFLSEQNQTILTYLKQNGLCINDNIDLTNFYQENTILKRILQFLDTINADIFFPIYHNKSIIGYIIIDRHARIEQFYSEAEHDQMLIFGIYLSNIINLLNNKKLETLIKVEKELKEELYIKHQEINQYKESIQSFLNNAHQKEIGIIFYKNRRFTFGNHAAKKMIPIDPNTQEGHPLSKALQSVARYVEEYKIPQTMLCTDNNGTKLMLAGMPNLEHKNSIISLYPPEIADVIKQQVNLLHDPAKWDYLLYLQTTEFGSLINNFIPSSGELFLNFKIKLLEAALSKKVLMLDFPSPDLVPAVELFHRISLRESLHILKLEGPSHTNEIATQLFGINQLFGTNTHKPLLERLDTIGTLFIKNIHFLDIESQEYLAKYIKYGFFYMFKSDQKISSSVRIICSSNHQLPTCIQNGTFSKNLGNELKKTTLTMPSLLTVSEEELHQLIDGFTKQLINTHAFTNLLTLSDKEKQKIIYNRPASLHELKANIHAILASKAKKNNILQETELNSACEASSDLELTHAARLGKHALKDQRIMTVLWNKFKNQNKIATFLGVNRSSVNRRCKEYNLEQ